jgi:drug/metabolite transporter (DMT)-like permease
MNWIFLAVAAQFLNAMVAVVDKRIISDEKILPRPFVYAFYTCLIAGAWIIVYFVSLLPIPLDKFHVPSFANVHKPTLEVVGLSILAAYTFFTALVSMFTALKEADASDVVPVIGATSAIASFGLGYLFLNAPVSQNFTLGIILLSIGTYLVSHFHFSWKTALIAIHAGIFFALHYIAIKGLFLITSFDDGFFWSRIGFMFYALSLLMVPTFFEKIREQTKSTTKRAGLLILSNKILAGVSTILILKATDLGDVAVVQALGGLQFVFILLLGIFFSMQYRYKHLCPIDEYNKDTILQKSLFVAVIAIGFLVLFK